MRTQDLKFWDTRDRLWRVDPTVGGAFVCPYKEGIDRCLAEILEKAGITERNWRQKRCRGLAETPALKALTPIVGRHYRPFAELRTFWLPFAASAACFYEMRRDAQPSLARLTEARATFEAALRRTRLEAFQAWSASPFRPVVENPVALQVCVEGLCEEIDAPISAFRDLRAALPAPEALRRHGNVDVRSHVFVDILSVAFFRFSGKVPTGPADLREFVTAAWKAVWKTDRKQCGDRIIRSPLPAADRLGGQYNDWGSFVECTRDAWTTLIDEGDFSLAQKAKMKHAVYECSISRSRRIWRGLCADGSRMAKRQTPEWKKNRPPRKKRN